MENMLGFGGINRNCTAAAKRHKVHSLLYTDVSFFIAAGHVRLQKVGFISAKSLVSRS